MTDDNVNFCNELPKEVVDYPTPLVNARLCELSKPRTVILFDNYRGFCHVLPPEKLANFGGLLYEDLAMTSEETAKKLRKIRKKYIKKKKTKQESARAKVEINELSKKKQTLLMKRCIKETLRTAIFNAYFNPPQIIMSDRLRKLSDIIVKDFCRLMKMRCIPSRKDTSRKAKFLFAIGDYFAHAIEKLYFDVQVKKVENYEEIKRLEKEQAEEEKRKKAEEKKGKKAEDKNSK